VNDYCQAAIDYLAHAYDPRRALFSWRSRLLDGVAVHDFDPLSRTLRYTINTYLGLGEAERHGAHIEWLGPVGERVAQFLAAYEAQIASGGDLGLLLVLLAGCDPSHPAVERALARIESVAARADAARALDMQELSWMLWGASAWSSQPRARALAERLFELAAEGFVVRETGLPRHSTRSYRAHTVSFGSIVYFLRAMHEHGTTSGEPRARELFAECLRTVLALQEQDGGWPWMIDVRTAVPIDVYPIFTVHQDSMAMLFLFPARDYGIAGVEQAIERSFRWNLGCNELHSAILVERPYAWFYRSIERCERWPRARRYLRGLGPRARTHPGRSREVRLNRECRSYHPGWILYAWSAYAQTPQLAGGQAASTARS
jgi:hypothetical protein